MHNENQNQIQTTSKPDKQTTIIESIEKSYESYQDMFSNISSMAAGDIVTIKSCKLCTHPKRFEAEQKWEQTKGSSGSGNVNTIMSLLNTYNEENDDETSFNPQNIKTHMFHHYNQQQRRLSLREYGRRLSELINYKIAKDQMFDMMSKSLLLKFLDIASDNEMNENKQVDAMVKLSKMIAEITTLQAQIRGDISTVEVFKDKFVNVISDFITTERNPERQKMMLSSLEMLKQNS